MIQLRSRIHAPRRGGYLGSSWGQAASTTAAGYGVPTTRAGAVQAGGVAAAGACTAYGGAAVAPACAAAGEFIMDSVIMPVAENVYGAIFGGGGEEDVAYKEMVLAKHNAAWAALRAKLSPLFPGAYAPKMEELIGWYLIGSFDQLQKEHGIQGASMDERNARWPAYEKALIAFVAPGGGRDQQLAAKTAALLAEQKQETGFDPVPASSPPAGPSLLTPERLAAGAAVLFAAWYFLLRKKRR